MISDRIGSDHMMISDRIDLISCYLISRVMSDRIDLISCDKVRVRGSGSKGQGPRGRSPRPGLKGLSEAQGVGSKRLGSKRLGSKRLGSKRLGANGQVPRGGDQGSWVEGPGPSGPNLGIQPGGGWGPGQCL